MKRRIILELIVIVLVCTGCKINSDGEVSSSLKINYINSEYLEKTVFIDNDELNYPTDIVCTEQLIYVVNQGNSNILTFDLKGELIDSFGKYGQGNSEFTNPQAISINDENIFVVDRDSCRIQVFDKKYNFIKEIIIDSLKNSNDVHALDLEVDNQGNIYLTVEGVIPKLLKIYKINSDGDIKKIGKELIGVMDRSTDDEIFFTPTYEVFETKEQLGYRSGKSFVSIINNSVEKKFDLTTKYTPTSIHLTEDRIYLFSNYMKQIDEFLFDGSYVSTLFRENPSDENDGMTHMDMYKDCFYMTDSKKNVIYMFKPQGD
ncbi:6-bladed beta-propeller [Clostridium sp. Marseille-P299]|uniref:6-bladed beta-propeller n=1 Tax=Clostridium sp. Marseille-P299 TaxID=1805477 RepID=UPI000836E759|nr:6-bladed beta-propeller [Clostridium sp. Marseille-P299]